jgi:ribosome-associated protein
MDVPVFQRDFSKEVRFTATRSSGPGGQNINKVSSRIELRFSVKESMVLTDDEKAIVLSKLATRINSEGELILVCQTERSQFRNKQVVYERFMFILATALKVEKKRFLTKPTKASKLRRITDKLKLSQKKQFRKFDDKE